VTGCFGCLWSLVKGFVALAVLGFLALLALTIGATIYQSRYGPPAEPAPPAAPAPGTPAPGGGTTPV
jgi:hypothetical protein